MKMYSNSTAVELKLTSFDMVSSHSADEFLLFNNALLNSYISTELLMLKKHCALKSMLLNVGKINLFSDVTTLTFQR
jgi:hypothetical protein